MVQDEEVSDSRRPYEELYDITRTIDSSVRKGVAISSSHNSADEDSSLPKYNAVSTGRQVLTFRRHYASSKVGNYLPNDTV